LPNIKIIILSLSCFVINIYLINIYLIKIENKLIKILKSKMKIQYIYLIQLREFLKSGEPIFKIGRTKQENFKRFYQYPKGSKILFQMICDDSNKLEKEIIIILKNKYIFRKDIGNEYFEGNFINMIDDIYKIIKK